LQKLPFFSASSAVAANLAVFYGAYAIVFMGVATLK
jgi:hypothetical protein